MKKFMCLLLIVVMGCAFVACESEKSENYVLEGMYAHGKTHEGIEIVTLITLRDDDTYQKTVIKDDRVSSTENGDYELVDGEVKLYDGSASVYHGMATIYGFENGNLTGPETVYRKISEN